MSFILVALIVFVIQDSFFEDGHALAKHCNLALVESIPLGLVFPPGSPSHPSTYEAWLSLLADSQTSIRIASSYWKLRGQDVEGYSWPSSEQGEEIFQLLVDRLANSTGDVSIVNSLPATPPVRDALNDTLILSQLGATVQYLDMPKVLGAGILHTKLLLSGSDSFYLGSANMDWRSLTQVKELGVHATNCSDMTKDLTKIFKIYQLVAGGSIPKRWPKNVMSNFNMDNPMKVSLNGIPASLFFTNSPPQLCPSGRTSDVEGVLRVIRRAQKFIHISLMDYYPGFLYSSQSNKYWPVIQNELIAAAMDRQVQVKLLMSRWNHTNPALIYNLKSLASLGEDPQIDIKISLFTVPEVNDPPIPYTRVNHNKYMVTENAALIGTSNWSADYFVYTGGISLVINETATDTKAAGIASNQTTMTQQLADIFERDWNSKYVIACC